MRRELQSELTAQYPLLLTAHPDAPGVNATGITCGDGWYALLDKLFAVISPMLERDAGLSNPPRLYEIATENDRLRILLRPMTPEMATYVYETMHRSESVCEQCGAEKVPGAGSLCSRCRPTRCKP
jgi:hypothetical protein